MKLQLKKLEEEVSSWPHVSVHPHRFSAKEFRFGKAEIGHVHDGGIVDIPFTKSIRDSLLDEGLAREHQWVPNSGWITFHIHSEQDLTHALWLLRLSYLRYALKTVGDPQRLLEQEMKALQLTPRFATLLGRFVPAEATPASNISSLA